ncbi:branched-chain amino acid ABC transporter permease [Chloroflexota bacterium]
MLDFFRFDWRPPLRYGLLAGIIALSLSAIGMVEAFGQRDLIAGVLSLGFLLLLSAPALAGYLSAQENPFARKPALLIGGFIGGLISALPLIGLIILASAVDLRELGLVNVSPALIDMLTFGLGVFPGSLVLAAVTAVLGLTGSAMFIMPARIRRPILYGFLVTLTVGLFSEIVIRVLRKLFGAGVGTLFFSGKALKLWAAVVIFVVAAGFIVWWDARKAKVQTRVSAVSPARQKRMRTTALVLGVVVMLALPLVMDPYLAEVIDQVGLYVLMGLGLNIVVGFAGLLDLGYVAFFAIGAYTMGVLTSQSPLGIGGLSFWAAIPLAVAAATLAGIILGMPVLRMRGDYLAIVTLGFGEIIRILVMSDFAKPLLGGAQGILLIPKPKLFGFELVGPSEFYYLIVVGCLLAAFVSWRLSESRLGRQWMAMREDEDVAEAVGIKLVNTKLLAFAFGAAFSGLSGAIFATRLSSIFPHSFNLLVSINVLCLIIVGGMGSLPGVVVGALVLVGLPELLREFAEYRLMIYGALLIVMMLTRPEGLWPSPIRRRELHSHDEEVPASSGAAAD